MKLDDPLDSDDYRVGLRARFARLKERKANFTLRSVAATIGVQYTHLSRALNNPDTHLTEDHLYNLCRAIEYSTAETDFVLLQRSHAVTGDPGRKNDLRRRIEKARQTRRLDVELVDPASTKLDAEMDYLFDHRCLLAHVALFVPEYRKDPRLLATRLGIGVAELREILRVLARNGFVELGDSPFDIRTLRKSFFHFGRDHPLMRVHQALLKTAIQGRNLGTVDEDKQSVLITFTLDRASYAKAQERFQVFLKDVERIARDSKPKEVYQINFDFFRWL